MKILLVQPSRIGDNGAILKRKMPFIRTLVLPYLAALTPAGIKVEIVDDSVEEINFNDDYDLIGITALTSQVLRAYQIADEFRKRGKKVVMGGIHATTLPEEAIQHCDAVVIGEAENVWEKLFDDCRKGNLKKFYRAQGFYELKNLPSPRFELLNGKSFHLPFIPIQASRGCPHDCDFCSVSEFYGKSYRFRPVEEVIEEIKISGAKRYVFIDDNITANKRYSKELFKALIPLKIKWIGQCTINFGRDPEMCRLAYESGCYFMGIGIESINQENLVRMDKGWSKVAEFPKLLNTIRKHRIGLVLNMIVGLDNDDKESFHKILHFLFKNNAFYLILNTPIPYPGTRLASKLEKEGRLLHKDWSKYIQGSVVFSPKSMSIESLKKGYWYILNRFFSYNSIARRSFSQSFKNLPFYLRRNIELRMSVRRRDY
jgi:radical SAM superfamily enzyme YgiQ (UPF0313 family)